MHKYSIWIAGLVALIGSLVANAILDTAFFPMTGVPTELETFNFAGPVGFFTFIGVVGATIVFAIVRRFSQNPNKVFTWIAAVVLAVSFLPDIFIHKLGGMFAEVTVSGAILLMVMHVACAVITVWALTRLTKPVVSA